MHTLALLQTPLQLRLRCECFYTTQGVSLFYDAFMTFDFTRSFLSMNLVHLLKYCSFDIISRLQFICECIFFFFFSLFSLVKDIKLSCTELGFYKVPYSGENIYWSFRDV